MIASTCLAVLFVPSFFTVLQRFEEWRSKKAKGGAEGRAGAGAGAAGTVRLSPQL